jgi:hypothetical protein
MAKKETPEKEQAAKAKPVPAKPQAPEEVGGRNGPEPTRYGDWEVKGICSDF